MSLVTSLLTAIVRADGDALVMHVGEKPYVVTTAGTIELSTSVLTLEAMSGMVGQLLPPDAISALSEVGAVEHQLTPPKEFRDLFNVVIARGGDDVWIEIRRNRTDVPASARPEPPASYGEAGGEAGGEASPSARLEPPASYPPPIASHSGTSLGEADGEAGLSARPEPPASYPPPHASHSGASSPPPLANNPGASSGAAGGAAGAEVSSAPPPPPPPPAPPPPAPPPPTTAPQPEPAPPPPPRVEPVTVVEPVARPEPEPEPEPVREPAGTGTEPEPEREPEPVPVMAAVAEVVVPVVEPVREPVVEPPPPLVEARVEAPIAAPVVVPPVHVPSLARAADASAGGRAEPVAPVAPPPRPEPVAPVTPDASVAPGVVVPMTRTLRIEVPARSVPGRHADAERLLSIAAARGASVLYLTSQSRPFLKIEGDVRPIENEATLASADVEAAVLELMPETAREAHSRGEPAEWVSEFEGIGRIRCTTFRDYRGAGALFQLISARPSSAEQLGLPREVQALATEVDGLVLVASPRGAGKSTVVAAFVDLINRQHAGYVITLERQIRIVHENRQSLITQREVRGTAADLVAPARAALRENPDVLVIEDLMSPDVIQLALDAAGSGLLVFLSVTAGSTISALMRVIDLFPPDRRKAVQAALAERLRGAVAQVLLRKAGGGRVAARELLLTTSAVAGLIAEGKIAQLAVAMDSGRKHGMVPLNDALMAFVQSGTVDVREAYRKADDRAALLALLKRDGLDISFAERLA